MKAVCLYCGKNFKGARDGNGSPPKFCCRSCYDNYRTEQRGFCANCGNRLKPTDTKFCSHECRVAFKKPQPRPCVNCGNIFSPIKFHGGIGRYIAHDSGKTCSRRCQLEWIRRNPERKRKISVAFKGPKHPNWQGGKTAVNISDHRGSDWLSIAAAIRKRDKYKCKRCGKTEEENRRKLDVHHIEPYHNFKTAKEANRKSNLISLCWSCHRKAENEIAEKQMILPFAAIAREDRRSARASINFC